MKSKSPESEQYLSASNRITGAIVLVIGALGLVDVLLEWRTATGVLVGSVIGIFMVLAYAGLMRPSVTLSPEHVLLRNHLRDRLIPWSKVTGVDVTDILRVHTDDNRYRAPGVQLIMRDLRKQRVGGRKLAADSSISKADFVVNRIETMQTQYADQSKGDVVTGWAKPELIALGALAVIAIVAAVIR
ncbi:PH domain-containing protein [Kribbella kalugense]|uniref:PH domain-containing protein n=1 Tax=Kribbella kalugense TaxID=2512221 RepID=UPI001066EB0B|nr:PH domain-containing protein [Kribbella kalugense]